jgi:hypothetical protein
VLETKKWRAKETDCADFWDQIMKDKRFTTWIESRYKLTGKIMTDDDIDNAMTAIGDDDE